MPRCRRCGADAELAALWRPRLTARAYDPSRRPVATKPAVTMGMAMTEKQGGSDVRANTTRAERGREGWRLTGHKWFCSAPMCDGFLTLAQARGRADLLPGAALAAGRHAQPVQHPAAEGQAGQPRQRLAEIEYDGPGRSMLGEEGRGVQTIIEMVHHTRLDTAMAPAGLMRAALVEARTGPPRTAFQRRLIDQPLMRAVLADLALEAEAALMSSDGGGERLRRPRTAALRPPLPWRWPSSCRTSARRG
jgi:putative acyl-CoA dehydrogenase